MRAGEICIESDPRSHPEILCLPVAKRLSTATPDADNYEIGNFPA
jgi:hypothetical protein